MTIEKIAYITSNGKKIRRIVNDTYLYFVKGEEVMYYNDYEYTHMLTKQDLGRYAKFLITGLKDE